MSAQPRWEEIEVPRGAYISWGTQPGQTVVGKVIDYDEAGGTDFAGDQCPALALDLIEPADSFTKSGERSTHEAGETVQINAGQVSLKRAVRKADPRPGDLVRIVLVNIAKLKGGRTVKEFAISVARTNQPPLLGRGSLESEADLEGDSEPTF